MFLASKIGCEFELMKKFAGSIWLRACRLGCCCVGSYNAVEAGYSRIGKVTLSK